MAENRAQNGKLRIKLLYFVHCFFCYFSLAIPSLATYILLILFMWIFFCPLIFIMNEEKTKAPTKMNTSMQLSLIVRTEKKTVMQKSEQMIVKKRTNIFQVIFFFAPPCC